jgi:uncharacterized protein HemY
MTNRASCAEDTTQAALAEIRVRAERSNSCAVLVADPDALECRAATTDARGELQHASANETLDIALELAKTAKAGLPDSADTGDTVGFVCYKKGLWSLAASSLRLAVEKVPANPSYLSHVGLGQAYQKNGDPAGARKSLEQALTWTS